MTNQGHDLANEPVFKWRTFLLICLLIIAATAMAYWKVGSCKFIGFDDPLYVTENPHVLQGLKPDSILWAFSLSKPHAKGYWQPLTYISLMADCQFFGENAGMSHIINLLIHIASALLLFLVLFQMTGALWESAFVAALFALHPLNVDSVAWVAERKNVLSTFFWMLTMLAYVNYAKRTSLSRYLLMVLAMTLGLLAKPMLVTLPCVLLLMDFWPLGRFEFATQENAGPNRFIRSPVSRLILEKIPLLILSFISIGFSVVSLQKTNQIVSGNIAPMTLRLENAVVSYVEYIIKIIWPHNMAVYYPFPSSIPLWQLIASGLALIFITLIIALTSLNRRRYLIVGWLWFVGTLLPVIGIIQGGTWPALADRWAYVPAVGIFIIISWGVADLFRGKRHIRTIRTVAAGVILITFIFMTQKQVSYWKDSRTLFGHALSVTKGNYLTEYNLGLALEKSGETDKAISHYKASLQFNPDNERAHNNLANLLVSKGKFDEAIAQYLAALKLNPDSIRYHFNLALALTDKGMLNKAIAQYHTVLKLDPENDSAQVGLATLLVKKGRLDEAMQHYRAALKINPRNVNAHSNLANALAQKGEYEKANVQFIAALKIKPNNADLHKNFAKALFAQNKMDASEAQFKAALATTPRDPEIYNALGAIMVRKNRINAAIKYFKKALEVKPGYEEAKKNLKQLIALKQKVDTATEQIHKKIAAQPENSKLYFELGTIYMNRQEYDKALQQYRKAVSLKPGFVDALYNIAIIHAFKKEYEKSIMNFKKIISIQPENSGCYYNIACIYSRQNKTGEAIAWLRKAIAHGYDNWKNLAVDPDLNNIRQTIYYQDIMKKHQNRIEGE